MVVTAPKNNRTRIAIVILDFLDSFFGILIGKVDSYSSEAFIFYQIKFIFKFIRYCYKCREN